jgi:hypothetical protein
MTKAKRRRLALIHILSDMKPPVSSDDVLCRKSDRRSEGMISLEDRIYLSVTGHLPEDF